MDKLQNNLEHLISAICKELPNISDGKTIYRISAALKFYTDKIISDNLDDISASEVEKGALFREIEDDVVELYACSRSWEAWQAGTMTKEDFDLIDLDHPILLKIADLRDA